MTTAIAAPTVTQLLDGVQKLGETELWQFETGLQQIWQKRKTSPDPEATKIVDKHRLPLYQQARLRELLFKNSEGELTEAEEEELDFFMLKMDRALEATADELGKLFEQRKQKQNN